MKRHLELADGILEYEVAGDGPLVVMSHAFGLLAWGAVEELRKNAIVAVVDWPASGVRSRSRWDWFEGLVAAEGAACATLCVWSMAGPGAIRYAASAPDSLARLVLVDVAGFRNDLPRLRLSELRAAVISSIRKRPIRGFTRTLWRTWVRADTPETRALAQQFHRLMQTGQFSGGRRQSTSIFASLRDDLASVAIPKLLLTGRFSTVMGPECAAEIAPSVDRVVVFESSAHALQIEEPDEFQRVVAQFLREERILG